MRKTSAWRLTPFDPESAEQRALWRAIASGAGASLVQMPEFVFNCAATMGQGELSLAVREEGGLANAAALVCRKRPLLPDIFQEPQMPLAAWVQSPVLDFPRLAEELLSSLGMALRLGFSQLDSRFVPRPADGTRLSTLDYMRTPWLEIRGSFDDYWSARGKNLRSNMRKQRERLAAQGTIARMEVLTEPADMVRGVNDYGALESAGWKAQGGTALSETHPQTIFYCRMLEAFAARSEARVYRYFFDEKLVATELCLCDDREFVILKTTFDETVTPFSPASLLRQDMFAGLHDEGKERRLEFFGPLKEWHTRWTQLSRDVYHANAFRSTIVRVAAEHLRRRAGRKVDVESAQPGTAARHAASTPATSELQS